MRTNETQPLPTEGEGDIMLALEKRVRERREKGVATYGRSLQAFNGRRALVDAVEEAVDLAAYLEQELHERAKLEAQLAAERERADEERYWKADARAAVERTEKQRDAAQATAGALRAALERIVGDEDDPNAGYGIALGDLEHARAALAAHSKAVGP